MCKHAEVGAKSGTLWVELVVRSQRCFEVLARARMLADARQHASHRVVGFAQARRIGEAAGEGLFGRAARPLHVAQHESMGERDPQPSHRQLSLSIGSRQGKDAIQVVGHVE